MTISRRQRNVRLAIVVAILVTLHFYLRPWVPARFAPDILLLAMMIVAIRIRPGAAAVMGFLVGLAIDSLTPARFGSGALSATIVGYLAAWGRAVFFPDNLVVNAGLFAMGLWVRNLLVLVVSGTTLTEFRDGVLIWSPLQALLTASCGVIVLLMFRDWLTIRLDE